MEGRVPSRPFGFGLLRLRGLGEVCEVELAPPKPGSGLILEGRVPSRPLGFELLRLRGLGEVCEVELAPP